MKNPSIDGLRTLAIGMVLLVHAGAPGASAGWLGVDLFFVLSGFLITSLLLREAARIGRISLSKFWGRRFLRLMPVYMLYVFGITLSIYLGPPDDIGTEGGWTIQAYIASLWLYCSNFAPQGGIWVHQERTIHLWSLAVEEQFYLLWPLAITFVPRLRSQSIWAWSLVLIMAASNLFLYGGHPPEALIHSRGIGLLVGCAFAISTHNNEAQMRRWGILSGPATSLAVGGLLLAYAGIAYESGARGADVSTMLPVGVPLFCLAAGVLVANFWTSTSLWSRWMSLKPLPQIGAISYGIYIYHMLSWEFVWGYLLADIEHWPRIPKFGIRLATYVSVTLLMAMLSYRFIEKPFLRIKERLRPRGMQGPDPDRPDTASPLPATERSDSRG